MKHEVTMLYTLAVYFASGVGPCTGIVETFKHLLRVTVHPQFLTLELRAPMGACLGQYGTIRHSFKIYGRWSVQKGTGTHTCSIQSR